MKTRITCQEEIAELKQRVDELKDSGNQSAYITAVENLVSAYSTSNILLDAEPYALELVEYYKKKSEVQKLARNYDFLARLKTYLPDLDKTEYYSRKALTLFEELSDQEGISYCYNNLGWVYRQRGKMETALEYLLKAISCVDDHLADTRSRKSDFFLRRISNIYEQVGLLYGVMKQMDQAREYFRKALEKSKIYGSEEDIYRELINLGVSYSDEDTDKTLSYYLEALPLVKEHGKVTILAVITNNIGGVYEDRGELDTALTYYEEALSIVDNVKMKRYRMYYLKHIGTVYYKQKKFNEALKYIKESLSEAENNQNNEEIEENYKLLSNIYKDLEDWQTALGYYEKYSDVKDKRLNAEVVKKVTHLQEKYEEARSKLVKTERKSSLITENLKRQMNMSFVGNSSAIKKVLKMAMTAAEHRDTNVLITGESGTGKEIIAHIIHYASERKDNLMIPVNCSSIPETLAESEFFGYKKGAFTGATKDKDGFLVDASNGTLFLDEIGDMPFSLQAKMLRALETKKIKQIGSSKDIDTDFRLIAATNKDINQMIKDNLFRIDLFYRINTLEIHIPPLRERKADIEPLLFFYVSYFAKILKKPVPRISKELIEELNSYQFPGNVRELKNMVERAMIMQRSEILDRSSFKISSVSNEGAPVMGSEYESLEEMEKAMIRQMLDKTGNNHTHTARRLGISYSTLNRKLKKYQIIQ